MGLQSAIAMSDEALGIDLETQILWHLKCNHYPAIHEDFVPVAIEAIDAVNEGYGINPILMPNGITKSAYGIVEGLHLENWIIESELY